LALFLTLSSAFIQPVNQLLLCYACILNEYSCGISVSSGVIIDLKRLSAMGNVNPQDGWKTVRTHLIISAGPFRRGRVSYTCKFSNKSSVFVGLVSTRCSRESRDARSM